jgi:hypothetical protein
MSAPEGPLKKLGYLVFKTPIANATMAELNTIFLVSFVASHHLREYWP